MVGQGSASLCHEVATCSLFSLRGCDPCGKKTEMSLRPTAKRYSFADYRRRHARSRRCGCPTAKRCHNEGVCSTTLMSSRGIYAVVIYYGKIPPPIRSILLQEITHARSGRTTASLTGDDNFAFSADKEYNLFYKVRLPSDSLFPSFGFYQPFAFYNCFFGLLA